MAKAEIKTAALYARVSTHNGQTPENQLRELRAVASNIAQWWYREGEFIGRSRQVASLAVVISNVAFGLKAEVLAWEPDSRYGSASDLSTAATDFCS